MENELHDDLHTRRRPSTCEGFGDQIGEFVRTRTASHWVMFLGGLVIGMVVG